MASLKITRVGGEESIHKITPAIEYAFEQHAGKGYFRAMTEDQRQSDIYWIAWKCLLSAGIEVKPWGEKFMEMLEAVEVVDDSPKE